ncbi:type IV pilus biogenesis protein PilP [Fundidesulfovibrio putealis]|uniref:type IV pilus biogenesis protein PilP n=1 Tax=Fundidesulfovibrio putealis TaxID=270496 RepID=UPI0004800B4D|nr:type IV pilus biogenesis protein PilP [Fundidesulfovibrio putealis]
MRFLDNKRIFWVVGGVFAAVSLIYMGSLAVSQWMSPPPPPIPQSSKAPKTPTVKPGKDIPTPSSQETQVRHPETSTANAQGETVPKAEPHIPVAGNLGVITTLRAQLEEMRIQAAIAQEREKIQPKAAPVQPQAIALPELPKSTLVPKAKDASPVVVSIQGVDGRSTATVRLGSGQLVSLRPGDRFSGGVVSAIDRRGVSIRRGHTSTILAFEQEVSWN